MITQGFDIELSGKVVVATVTERELTGPITTELVEQLTQRLRYDNCGLFVLDLTAVEYVASACLGPMVTFLQDLEHVRGHIALAGCCSNVQFLFNVTRLDTVFPLYDDVEEACRELAGP